MKGTRIKASDKIRQAVDASGMSRYRICKELGIGQGTFSRFMHGGWIGVDVFDDLSDLLGIEITVTTKARPDKGDTGARRSK